MKSVEAVRVPASSSFCPKAMTECYHFVGKHLFVNDFISKHSCQGNLRCANQALITALKVVNLAAIISRLESTSLNNVLPCEVRRRDWSEALFRHQV